MKLGLGTVQFGQNYGISNQRGKTPINEAVAILQYAEDKGIDLIDTASLYGESENVLGTLLPDQHNFRIVTKSAIYKKEKTSSNNAEDLKLKFYNSLNKLGESRLYGLLIHDADDLLVEGGDILYNVLQELKKDGLVDKFGVSVYSGEQIDHLLKRYTIDLIQVPVNVLDQRLINNSYLKRLKEKDIEIHVRSVFLQGLLLTDTESLHSFFDPIKPILFKYRDFLYSHGLNPIDGAIGFIKGVSEIDYVIIGVDNLAQLKENVKCFSKSYDNSLFDSLKMYSLDDPKYLNPSLWEI